MPECPACTRSADASAALAARGVRVTPLRTRVLTALHHAGRPLGAYELFDRLKAEGAASAPPAVYRVLDFLETQGLVHKLQSLSAYTACRTAPHPHHAQFLICRACGAVAELETPALDRLAREAAGTGFLVERMSVETRGLCTACAAA
ncbi:transcriptional repressor [Paroceanicella profunda]|uniref:Ferric uptake regulation protein n=1 Tax=Paroceanicella profunda TaxID=2579971 RepID=A0A5B8FGY5_9RHOB|nr:Fur family transcriptional regulator [Paroceanicella profunda]QDL91801.1 transcriptional repressor [Paroceanicella profunda]